MSNRNFDQHLNKETRPYAFLIGNPISTRLSVTVSGDIKEIVCIKKGPMSNETWHSVRGTIMCYYGIDVDDQVFFGDCWYEIQNAKTFEHFIPDKVTMLYIASDMISLYQADSKPMMKSIDVIYGGISNIMTSDDKPWDAEIYKKLVFNYFLEELLRLVKGSMDSPKAFYPDFTELVAERYDELADRFISAYGSESPIVPKGYFRDTIKTIFNGGKSDGNV